MMFSRACAVHAGLSPLWRLQAWAIERLVSILSPSGDLRWGIATLAAIALAGALIRIRVIADVSPAAAPQADDFAR